MSKRRRRVRPTTRKARARRTELFRLLRRSRVRKADREAYLAELDKISPYPPEPSADVHQ
jgi:hypothetical protein